LTKKHAAAVVLFLIAVFFLTSCNVTRNFRANEYLLVKNKFRISSSKISQEDLSGYLQQKPNSKLFGVFHANIAFYNWGKKGEDSKFKKWLRTSVGAEPVILDTGLVSISVKQMALFLANKGYFQSIITDTVMLHRKKATVRYVVKLSKPYMIRNIHYSIPDSNLAPFVYADSTKCLIRKGNSYDAYLIDSERSRITRNLMNHGFYHFTNTFIVFRIDSAMGDRQMDIKIEITNPVVPSLEDFSTVVETNHKQYFINNIYIYPNIDLLQSDTLKMDTITRTYHETRHDTIPRTYHFLFRNNIIIQSRTITQAVFIKSGNYYNLDDIDRTYSQLSSLQVYKYINLQFTEASAPAASPHKDLLDCFIRLSKAPAQSFAIAADGTNSAGDLGVQGNVVYQNRNIFGGAQLLSLSVNVSTQMQGSISASANKSLFNTLEIGTNASITFPQFLIPIRPEKLEKSFHPKTSVSVGYNFQRRLDYNRHISNVSFGYSWTQNERIRHRLNPIEILFVKVYPDSSFSAFLDQLTDKRLRNQYTNHIVAGLKYTFTFNNQNVSKFKDYVYIRANMETGGNLLYGIDYLLKAEKTASGYYTLFNIPYAQFVRPDVDFRYYNLITRNTSLVYRFYGGIAIPYGNSSAIPFEKAFFGGGANDIRGWKMGTLGPGSYRNDTLNSSFDQTGDILLQMNLEYRFPVYKFIKSAVFLDAGNIWLLKENTDFPGGKFEFSRFLSQVALNIGIGIRADFDFFILRIDPAIPLRTPSYPENNHWYFGKLGISDIIWNFGIGYPF